MYLVDTNIWLELLLDQEKAEEVLSFFKRVDSQKIHISEFSLYSIGVILTRFDKKDVLRNFVTDLLYDSQVDVIRLLGEDHFKIIEAMENYSLDYDDGYQYAAARKMSFDLVSFDSDFNKTPEKKLLPDQIN